MQTNIQITVDRGERLKEIVDKSDELNANSLIFKKNARSVENELYFMVTRWWRDHKFKLIIAFSLVMTLIIWAILNFSIINRP